MVLLHGFTEANTSWFELARSLEKEYDLILPDLLGHGNSDRLTAGERVDLQQDLAELIAGLGVQKTALLGHSLGALTAAQFAARNPGRVEALILADIPWFEPTCLPNIPPQVYYAARPEIIIRLAKGGLASALEYCAEHFPRWNEAAREAWSESKLRFDLEWFKRPPQQSSGWRETASAFRFPTLLISGDNQLGSLISPGFALRALKEIPHLEWARIPNAGHYLHYDAPEAFLLNVQTFLRLNYKTQKG